MKTFVALVEDNSGRVIGANTVQGDITLLPEEIVHRSEFRSVAPLLATKYGVDPASFTLPAPTPSPAGNDSTPQGAD